MNTLADLALTLLLCLAAGIIIGVLYPRRKR